MQKVEMAPWRERLSRFLELEGKFFSYSFRGLGRSKSRATSDYEAQLQRYLPRSFEGGLRVLARTRVEQFALPVGEGCLFVPASLEDRYVKWRRWLRNRFNRERRMLRESRGEIESNIDRLREVYDGEVFSFDQILEGLELKIFERPNPLHGMDMERLSEFEQNYVEEVLDRLESSFNRRLAHGIDRLAFTVQRLPYHHKRLLRLAVRELETLRSLDVFNQAEYVLREVERALAAHFDNRTPDIAGLRVMSTGLQRGLRTSIRRLASALETAGSST